MVLKGERLFLTPITEQDTKDIIRWRNQDFVRGRFIYQGLFTKESHEKWLRTKVASGEVVQFIIRLNESQRAIGSVYFRDIDSIHQKAEYGIFIGEADCLGQGYGTDAAGLAMNYAFEEMRLNKLMLRVLADNKRAIRSYEKAGFVEEGRFKEDVCIEGRYYDVIFMAVLRGDYMERLSCQ